MRRATANGAAAEVRNLETGERWNGWSPAGVGAVYSRVPSPIPPNVMLTLTSDLGAASERYLTTYSPEKRCPRVA